jgi:hypothetical protein
MLNRMPYHNIFCLGYYDKRMDIKVCAFCGKEFSHEGWPHVEGDSNRGVIKIEQFCSEDHKYYFLESNEGET